MQASGFIREPETGEIVQGDFNGGGATALRKSLAEIASVPLIDLGVGLVGETAMSVPAIRRAVTASRVARDLNRGAKEMRSITESARRSASPLIKEVETLPVSSSDYSLTRTPSYSGSIPTKVSEMSRRFVDDVDEAVGWAMRRGRPAEPVFKYWGHELPLYQDAGAEMYVYPNVVSNHILKQPHAEAILGEGIHPIENYSTPENAFEFGKEWLKRNNNRPYNLNVDLVGYTDNFVGGYSPVFRQKKVAIAKNNTIVAPESKLKNLAQRIGERSSKYSAYPDGFPEKFLDSPYVLPDGVAPANNIIYENDFQVLLKDPITGKELPMLETKDFRPDNVGAIGPDKKLMGIDLKKYGGLVSRLQKHYGSNEKALEAVRKFAGGGDTNAMYDPNGVMWSQQPPTELPEVMVRGLYDWDAMKLRQYWGESRFRDNLTSPAGAKGAFQIMPITQKDYILRGGVEGDLMDRAYNEGIRDDLVALLRGDPYFDEANTSPESFAAMVTGAYNIGRSGFKKRLKELENQGYDIRHSTDWVDAFPVTETRNYMKWVGLGQNVGGDLTNEEFNAAVEKNGFKSGGKIHIKPSKRGTFTAAAKKHGKSVQAFASQVLAHKENYSPAMIKKANFARNARKFKHGDGGIIDRLYNHSGGDVGKMLELIQKARSA